MRNIPHAFAAPGGGPVPVLNAFPAQPYAAQGFAFFSVDFGKGGMGVAFVMSIAAPSHPVEW